VSLPPNIDVYQKAEEYTQERCRQDILYMLLQGDDSDVIYRHARGLICNDENDVGLLIAQYRDSETHSSYFSSISTTSMSALLQEIDSAIGNQFYKHHHVLRPACQALLLTALIYEPEYFRYIVSKCQKTDCLNMYIQHCLKPLNADLIRGKLLRAEGSPVQNTVALERYVELCVYGYTQFCRIDVNHQACEKMLHVV